MRSLVRMDEVKGRKEVYVTIVGFQGTVRSAPSCRRVNLTHRKTKPQARVEIGNSRPFSGISAQEDIQGACRDGLLSSRHVIPRRFASPPNLVCGD